VIANGAFLGMIDRNLLRAMPQGYWDERTVAEAMLPAARLVIVAPTTPVSMLIPHLASDAIVQQPYIAVVREGQLLGMIDADELLALLELEDEFGLFGRGPIARQPGITPPATKAEEREIPASEYAAQQHAVGQ
jgi:hypothetical protein